MDLDEEHILFLLALDECITVESENKDDTYTDLLKNELIKTIPEGKWVVTTKGMAYIRSLLRVPLPIENIQWITDWDKIDDN